MTVEENIKLKTDPCIQDINIYIIALKKYLSENTIIDLPDDTGIIRKENK